MTSPFLPLLLALFSLAVALNQELLLAPALTALYLAITGQVALALATSWRRTAKATLRAQVALRSLKLQRLGLQAALYRDCRMFLVSRSLLLPALAFQGSLATALAGAAPFGPLLRRRLYQGLLAEALGEQFTLVRNRLLALGSGPLERSLRSLLGSRTDLAYGALGSALPQRRGFSTLAYGADLPSFPHPAP
jgi:hypothetical protein